MMACLTMSATVSRKAMVDPEGIVGIISVFGMPVFIVGIVSYFRYKTQLLRAKQQEDPKQLEKEREERKQLEARVQNLESIVCSVDLELNARMNRMLAAQSAIGALPPAAAPFATGREIAGRYVIERELGHGGMGTVYLAYRDDGGFTRRAAVKVIRRGRSRARWCSGRRSSGRS